MNATTPHPVLPLTDARVQLFRLAEELLSGQVPRVRLTHRSQPEDLLLIRASVVEQLEQEITELRARVAPAARSLAGLGTMLVSEQALLADLIESRARDEVAADQKRSELAKGFRYPATASALSRVAEGAVRVPAARTKKAAPKRREQ